MNVLGVDLSPIQPSGFPSNCSFRVQNVETEWDSDERFDLIHARAMIVAFTDWPQFFKNCYKYYCLLALIKILTEYRYLKPGGYIELHEFCLPTSSLSGVVTSPGLEYTKLLSTMLSNMGRDPSAPAKWEEQLQAAGFKDLYMKWDKWPIGPWAKGQKNQILGQLFARNTTEGVNTVAPILSRQNWDPEQIKLLIQKTQTEFSDPGAKSYLYSELCYCYAQKPE